MEEMARRYGQLNAIALRIAKAELPYALASGNRMAVQMVMDKIEDAQNADLGDDGIRTAARNMGNRVEEQHSKAFWAGLGVAIGVQFIGDDTTRRRPVDRRPGDKDRPRYLPHLNGGPPILVDGYVQRNVHYLGKLRDGTRAGMLQAIAQNVTTQQGDPRELTGRMLDDWTARGVPSNIGVNRVTESRLPVLLRLESHAHMIAGDEIARLNGELSQSRLMAAGLGSAVWESQRDNRVRPQHREWQGQIFTWQEGIDGTFPGLPFNCRCYARAILMEDRLRLRAQHIAIDEPPVDFDATQPSL